MKRDIAIDYLRSGVTVSVVAHHAALAYTTFSRYDQVNYMKSTAPVVDAVRFSPLDCLVGWNDLFFMALMFLISGLFVAPSIARKGAGRFVADRMKRLGIPFVVSAFLLSPLAFYPSRLLSESAGREGYLSDFFSSDTWTPGPAWFIWTLLVYSAVVAAAFKFFPNLMKKLSWSAGSAGGLVVVFLTASLAATIPLRLLIAPGEWYRLAGPLVFPASRFLLYFAWFLLGIALGSADQERSLSRENLRFQLLWLIFGALGYVAHALLSSGACFTEAPRWALEVAVSAALSFCCAFTCLAALGLARSFFRNARSVADDFSANAYGIYIFHYAFVIWMQFVLLAQPWPAAVKFLVAFSVALTANWMLTAALRKTAAGRVL